MEYIDTERFKKWFQHLEANDDDDDGRESDGTEARVTGWNNIYNRLLNCVKLIAVKVVLLSPT